MKKLDLVNKQITSIKEYPLIKCIFTDNIIYNDNDLKINLYLYINQTEYNEVYKIISNEMELYNTLVHNIDKNDENALVSSYYYENSLNINIYYLFNYDYLIKNNIVSLYDPYNILNNFNSQKFPLTNKEFANSIDLFCEQLYEIYNLYIQDDKLGAYKKALKTQEIFVLIYRGFYDSMNAKKKYKDCKTMNQKFYNNLLGLIKSFKYDSIIDNMQMMINEVDKMINQLPVNIITLFNFDFYTFTRKLIFSL